MLPYCTAFVDKLIVNSKFYQSNAILSEIRRALTILMVSALYYQYSMAE